MARPVRIEYPGALYHVTSRGDRQEAIFDDDQDRRAFLKVLGDVVSRYRWRRHAYFLMGNHYHLMIETPEANLTKGMRQLNGVFTQCSNRRHKRSGHLFQGRYKAILVDRDSYFLELARYVVLNPVRARQGQVSPPMGVEQLRCDDRQGYATCVVTTDDLLAEFGKRRPGARRKYQEFITEGMGSESIWKDLKGQIYLGDDDFVEQMREKLGGQARDVNIPRVQQRGAAPKVSSIRRQYPNRDEAMRAAYETGAYSYQQIAKEFGVHFTTVGRIVRWPVERNSVVRGRK